MIILGGILGLLLGGALAAGLLAVSGLPVFGPAAAIVAAIVSTGPAALLTHVFTPIVTLFGAGLSLFVATIFIYAAGAVSLLGVAAPAPPAAPALPAPPVELLCRGMLIGMASSVNFLIMSVIPWLSLLAGPVFIITALALIPPIAASRFIYQPLLGLVGWILPLNYLVLPLGILLFVLNLPFAIAAGGIGAIRFDFLTMTIETTGGALAGALFAASPAPAAAFNLGNFSFLAPATAPTGFAAAGGISAHETGHTLTNAAFGGFYGWVNAVDENIPPPGRGTLAYGELVTESHFSGLALPFLPMW